MKHLDVTKALLACLLVMSLLCSFSFAEDAYPLTGEKKQLTLYSVGGWGYHSDYASEEESPLHQILEEATGVDIIWQHAPAGADEWMAFNMLLASGEYPDIIYMWELPARSEVLIEDNVILPLEDYMAEYAPALHAYMEANPAVAKAITTDAGHEYVFPFLRESNKLNVAQGLSVNTQLLKDAGLDMPVTLEDWEKMLYAFKDMDECTEPLSIYQADALRWGFGNAFGFNGNDNYYVDAEGKVATFMNADGYYAFLETMHRWYSDGIIDKDFASMDLMGYVSKIVTDKLGSVWYGLNTPARFYDQIVERDGEFPYEPAHQVIAKEGDVVYYSFGANEWVGAGAVITTACKDVETAMRFLDYGYTDEGIITWNYGKEGVSFYYDENGTPQIYDEILNAAEGSTAALSRYTAMVNTGISIQDEDWFKAKSLPFVPNMMDVWTEDSVSEAHHWPNVSSTADEGVELADLQNAVETYANEMYMNFILGNEPLSNYDEYIKTLDEMGLQRILEIKSQQLERYNNR